MVGNGRGYHLEYGNSWFNFRENGGAVLDQEGVLRDVKDDEEKCNMKIIRLKGKLR